MALYMDVYQSLRPPYLPLWLAVIAGLSVDLVLVYPKLG